MIARRGYRIYRSPFMAMLARMTPMLPQMGMIAAALVAALAALLVHNALFKKFLPED